MSLGIASATAPEQFKPLLFAISMVLGVFFLWLLVCSQWPWLLKLHNERRRLILSIFGVVLVISSGFSLLPVFRAEKEPSPLKVDVADIQGRQDTEKRFAVVSTQLDQALSLLGATSNQLTEASNKLVDLNQKLGFRKIPEEQVPVFIAALRNVPRGRVTVVRDCQTVECVEFSRAIHSLLTKAGFSVSGEIQEMLSSGVRVGVAIGVANPNNYPAHGGQLQAAFSAIGINAEGAKFGPPEEPDVVSVIVGQKEP